eukprot:m.238781 g.238781  ORF g.238781 m.238781 type:complete len:563 (+) comp40172_c0_seq1:55-1743(+)
MLLFASKKMIAVFLLGVILIVLLHVIRESHVPKRQPRISKSLCLIDTSTGEICKQGVPKKKFTLTEIIKENPTAAKQHVTKKPEIPAETSEAFSTWKLITTRPMQGKPLNILLTARDKSNQIQSKGKDLIYPKITNPSLGFSQMGRVHDYENGTYLITFIPGWAGTAEITVTLFMTARVGFYVNSHPNVEYLFTCTYDKMKTKGLDLLKTVPHGSPRRNPSGACHFDSKFIPTPRSACDLNKPDQGWFGYCMLPSGANCDDMSWCYYSPEMPGRWKLFWQNGVMRRDNVNQLLKGDRIKIIIKPATSDVPKPAPIPCHKLQNIRLQGYWKTNVYHNTNCLAHCGTKERLSRCLQNMNLTVLGDSTIRQLVSFIIEFIHESKSSLPKIFYAYFKDTNRNLSVHYSCHGLPIMTSTYVPFTFVKWSSETIDEINPSDGGQTTYILISNIHHSVITPSTMFKRRLTNMRDALVRLNKRAPLAKTIYLTANARIGTESSINDYKIRYFNDIAYEVFNNVPGVVFVDRWEMYLGSRFKPQVHYPETVIGELLKIVCSIFRPKSDCDN